MFTRIIIVAMLVIAFMVAGCSKSPEEARKELGQMNLGFNSTAFLGTIANNDLVAFKLFLAAGMDPNVKVLADKQTPLMHASAHNRVEMAKILIDKGAIVNAKDKDGFSVLMGAVASEEGDNAEAVKLLLDKGADVQATTKDGITVLMAAIASKAENNAATVKLLLDKGADVNAANKEGITVLMAAAQKGNLEILKLILAKQPNLEAQDKQYQLTALTYAVGEKHTEIVKELIAQGANVNTKGNSGITPLALAKTGERKEIYDLLVNAGATDGRAIPAVVPLSSTAGKNITPQSIMGEWNVNGGSWGMTLNLTIDGGYLVGQHNAFANNGNRIDAKRTTSISGKYTGTSPIIVRWISGYSDVSGEAEITIIDNATIKWRILSATAGEHYLPKEAVLKKVQR